MKQRLFRFVLRRRVFEEVRRCLRAIKFSVTLEQILAAKDAKTSEAFQSCRLIEL
jgi:hypothetical protein